ncbi:MAG: glycosyltransferase family 2 protein [Lachnospiraceae bacterium]|nr:glycosyltransferase family 2 protein [Lachnospiraceae bacterium]
MKAKLAIVVPCYNEQEVFPICRSTLCDVIKDLAGKGKISEDSFVLFVNDGSTDSTRELMNEAAQSSNNVWAISLTKNCGHQSALLAGLMEARKYADVTVSIDADLQDDVKVIEEMLDRFAEGCDIVYGVRSGRKTDSFMKRSTAQLYYRLLEKLGVKSVYNHADFRLMSRRALDELARYKESNLYLRGLIPQLGFKTASVYYERKERMAGESKYPFSKMLNLAINGITSFSTRPIKMVMHLGFFVMLVCFAAAIYAFVSYFNNDVERGWTSVILSIWFLGGVQLISFGIVGEYIGRIYTEVKGRPLYCIEEFISHGEENRDVREKE